MELRIRRTNSHHGRKDQAKAKIATKFIGRGSNRSSTHLYGLQFGELANPGVYTEDDKVFVSVEGARKGRLPLDAEEVTKAVLAGARIICDNCYNRNRDYNVGERELYALLYRLGAVCLTYNSSFAIYRLKK